jgi:hypothetical protein
MTIEDLLDEIADRGWLVNNLFQRADGSWQANLRTATHHTDWGVADSPAIALSLAIDAIETAEEFESRPIISSVESRANISDLISRLQPAVKITRRI